jgi:hypothetical protein
MNILRNMEALFIVAVALTCASAYAAPSAVRTPAQTTVSSAKMIKVIVVGKRLSAVQKASQQRYASR